ncbi:PREDICTED: coiled-coil domain-containing protein 15 isoform X2 [Condylura cristata]|uniref:coiled-coil domain-containing protein 15 isoform X1 n=1 Tax=Condylura cristata TaxID=143302 RepID=UPI000642AC9A|nr:PREDICTED: coiled-coil domain-containing protein 15 isoform X1 [Condylura cristata]XP_012584804.1 PREDICTED: coiled-coil domain-containing protein 15 isoform X1 [Condylura cristata]XP_012584805.1 PREDICTED: coiled-coil domain-containing protein 15 isoform X2 [Condylura cristata]
MPGSMAPLRKPRNTRLPLALNPLKSKDVLAVLAERNQAVVPVGAWVEPASPHSSEIPAYTLACKIEEELKEQLRKKQEALKHFQRQVKYRVNQQVRLRKKQQFQRIYEVTEKESAPVMKTIDPILLTSKRTSVFPKKLNAAIGNVRLPSSQLRGDRREDRENQNELFQQQAQPLRQSMKQARHQPASIKTVSKKHAESPDDRRKSFSTQEEPDSEEVSSAMIEEKGGENLFWRDQKDLLPEDSIPSSRVQKVQFKNPLFAVMEEEKLKQLQSLEDVFPQTQNDFPEAQGDLVETQDLTSIQSIKPTGIQSVKPDTQATEEAQGDLVETQGLPGIQSVKPDTQAIELEAQAVVPKAQTTEPEAQAVNTDTQGIMPEARSSELEDGNIMLEVQDFLPQSYTFVTQNQNFGPRDLRLLSCDQTILIPWQDQDFLPEDQNVFLDQHWCVIKEEGPREESPLEYHQYVRPKILDQAFLREEHRNYGPTSCYVTNESWRKESFPECHEHVLHAMQDPCSAREQNLRLRQQQPSVVKVERWRKDMLLDGHQPLPSKHQRETSHRRKVYDEYQSRLNTKFQNPLAFQSGVDQEEAKKERQKQYLRYRRLFMDIEREQVKEYQRQKERKKKIEKIKKKKEQQRYAEEQRILRMNSHKEPPSGEKMSEVLAQLQLEEMKEAREKQQEEKENLRYVEALRAQIQEKMQLYNITLPPLCCCGPEFLDTHPDTCANNCIFYKNYRAYTRALQSVINSCDIPEGNSALRVAIHNSASACRQTLKNL